MGTSVFVSFFLRVPNLVRLDPLNVSCNILRRKIMKQYILSSPLSGMEFLPYWHIFLMYWLFVRNEHHLEMTLDNSVYQEHKCKYKQRYTHMNYRASEQMITDTFSPLNAA